MTDGKCFIVTGAAGGLGAHTVEALADRAVNVMAVDLDEAGLRNLRIKTEGKAGQVVIRPADVSDEQNVRAFVQDAQERWGRLDGIFNNAAIEGPVGPVTDYPVSDFDRVMRVNARSVFLGMKHAVPVLLEGGGGSILNTASTGGMMGWADLSGYIASKHAVIGMTRAVALELAGKRVRVNALAPGPMDTRMIWSLGEQLVPGDKRGAQKLFEDTIPAHRLGQPDEVASVAVWLLLSAPDYLTGAVIPVDGAQTAG